MKRPVSRINLAFPTLRAPSFEPSTSRHCFLFLFFFFRIEKSCAKSISRFAKNFIRFYTRFEEEITLDKFLSASCHVTKGIFLADLPRGKWSSAHIVRGGRWSVNANAQLPISDSTTSLFLSSYLKFRPSDRGQR